MSKRGPYCGLIIFDTFPHSLSLVISAHKEKISCISPLKNWTFEPLFEYIFLLRSTKSQLLERRNNWGLLFLLCYFFIYTFSHVTIFRLKNNGSEIFLLNIISWWTARNIGKKTWSSSEKWPVQGKAVCYCTHCNFYPRFTLTWRSIPQTGDQTKYFSRLVTILMNWSWLSGSS